MSVLSPRRDRIRTQSAPASRKLRGRGNRNEVRMHDQSTTKVCSACGETLPLDSFHRHHASPGGRRLRCRGCVAAYKRDYYARRDVEKLRAQQDVAAQASPTKVCSQCGVERPRSDFSKDGNSTDGLRAYCYRCFRKYDAAYRKRNPDRIAEKAERQRERSRERSAAWLAENPEKRKAENFAYDRIRTGELVPQSCAVCGTEKTEAHHDDYTRPLIVRWLCRSCHRRHHAEDARTNRGEA